MGGWVNTWGVPGAEIWGLSVYSPPWKTGRQPWAWTTNFERSCAKDKDWLLTELFIIPSIQYYTVVAHLNSWAYELGVHRLTWGKDILANFVLYLGSENRRGKSLLTLSLGLLIATPLGFYTGAYWKEHHGQRKHKNFKNYVLKNLRRLRYLMFFFLECACIFVGSLFYSRQMQSVLELIFQDPPGPLALQSPCPPITWFTVLYYM